MKILNSVLATLLLLLQYQLWFGEGSLLEIWQLKQSRDAQKLENEDLRERNAALEAEVLDLKQGFEAIEERARTEMGMIKADEIFYQIVGEEEDGQNNEQQDKP
ncbi:MAG TPA: cell division protein FtsB [Gammaproteobacteria bacterium]|nr:cell division protein FtsB [Gammaproteobacteria bacterium]